MRRNYGSLEIEKNLHLEENQRLKAWVKEVEITVKETLKSMDKLQVDLDQANSLMTKLEAKAKVAEESTEVANLGARGLSYCND